jgi:hypothetical protein
MRVSLAKTDHIHRQEIKYFIRSHDVIILTELLRSVMIIDENMPDQRGYEVSSLYYDSIDNCDLHAKLNGDLKRKKFRIRIYNNDTSFGKFEIKKKLGTTISKISLPLNHSQIQSLSKSDFDCLKREGFYDARQTMLDNRYEPKCIVKYNRIAYQLPFNRIRVTIDTNILTSGYNCSFDKDSNGIKVIPTSLEVVEIKFEDYIPNSILHCIEKFALARTAISKYTGARLFSINDQSGDYPYYAW